MASSKSVSTHCTPRMRVLDPDQIQVIHRASIEVLETIGIRILNPEGVELLRKAGCTIKDGNVALIPSALVDECLNSAPSCITIYNRRGEEAMRLEGRNSYYGMGTDLLRTVDLETGETRLSVLQDVRNAARVGDYCGNVDFIASFALPSDVPTNTMYLECVRAMLESSTKPIFNTAAGKEDLAYIIEMCEAVMGGEQALREKPIFIHYSEPTPPLTHSYGAINKLFLCADKSLPICYPPGAVGGGTCPVTLAGGIVQTNAEALSGVVLHQLRKKGAPIISGFGAISMDMRTTVFSYASPDFRLTNSAMADMYEHYGLPRWSTVGSDAHCLDEQASMEHAFSTLTSSLDGANLIHDIGYLGQGLLGNPAAIVMSDEIISYARHYLRGFEITPEKIGLDVIRKVGPGGNFLMEEHTVKNFRQELWRPKFVNRDNPDNWVTKGSPRYGDLVREKARHILRTHQPEPLSPVVLQRLAEISASATHALDGFQFKA